MTRIVLVYVLLICCYTATAGDLERAFKYINTGDYDKALQSIRDELTDDAKNPAANFAMAKLYSSRDFKKYNIDSATIYANKSYAAIPLNPEDKQVKKYIKLGVRDYTIKELFYEINKTAFDKAKAVNSFESFSHFLLYSKDSALNIKATDKRDEIKYEEIKVREDITQLKEFLNNYPQSKKFAPADSLYEKLLYSQLTKTGTYQCYKDYMDKYPTGPYVKDAKLNYEEKLYKWYLNKNDIEAYAEFENNYPTNPNMAKVQDSIYSLSTRNQTSADYNAFIKAYPANKHIIDAWNQLLELYTLNAADSEYAFFQKIYPNNPLKDRIERELYLAKLPLAPYKADEKFGYVNTATQTLVIAPQYYEASDFANGLAAVALKPCTDSCLYVYINKAGTIAFENTFSNAGDFENGKAIVATTFCNGDPCNYGVINRKGEFVISPIYTDLQHADKGLYAAQNSKSLYGFITNLGSVVVPFQYQDVTPFSDGIAAVKKDSVWIYINATGSPLFTQSFKNASPFSSGFAVSTANDSTYGYIDKTGTWAIAPTYEYAEPFIGDTAIVTLKETKKKSKDYGLSFRYKIDKTGKSCYKLINPNAATTKRSDTKKKKKK